MSDKSASFTPRLSTTYTVQIDVTSGAITYSVSPSGNASNLQVQTGDIVKWKAKTTGSKHRLTTLFVQQTPFVDTDGNPVWAFEGNEGNEGKAPGIGGNATIGAAASGEYKYSVAVFDDNLKSTLTDDPRIIIGGKGVRKVAGRMQLINAAGDLRKAALLRPGIKHKILPMEKALEKLITNLKK